MLIRMHVESVAVDPETRVPIVILKDKENERSLPIWIGLVEAGAIVMALEDMSLSRPMTHDIMFNLLASVEVEVASVEVNDIRDNVYYATIHLAAHGERSIVDARPSDAIALALRANCPIMVDTKVIEKSKDIKVTMLDKNVSDPDELADILGSLDSEDFGKYKM